MVGILGLMLVLLQQQFNQGDYRRAMELIAAPQPGAKWSIGQELVERSKGGQPDCRPKLLSSFKGTLEVTCYTGEAQPYKFDVDLVRRAVTAINPAAQELVETVAEKNRALPPGPSGAGPPDSGSDGGDHRQSISN
jgi:hypothetical protein